MDVSGGEAGGLKLATGGLGQVDAAAIGFQVSHQAVGSGHGLAGEPGERGVGGLPAAELGGVDELAGEFLEYFVSDLEAAGLNAGPDRGEEDGGVAAKAASHFADRLFHYAADETPPAGVDSGDDALAWIGHQDGQAVGGLDADQDTRVSGDQGVAAVTRVEMGPGDVDLGGMDLAQSDQAHTAGAERPQEAKPGVR